MKLFYLIQLDRWAYPSIRLHFLLHSTGQNVINLTHSNHLMALHPNCARGQGHVFFLKTTSQSFIWTAFSSACGSCIIRTISSCSHDDSMYCCLQSHALHGSISIVLWSPLILREWLVFAQFTSNQKHERLHAPHCLWRSYFLLLLYLGLFGSKCTRSIWPEPICVMLGFSPHVCVGSFRCFIPQYKHMQLVGLV